MYYEFSFFLKKVAVEYLVIYWAYAFWYYFFILTRAVEPLGALAFLKFLMRFGNIRPHLAQWSPNATRVLNLQIHIQIEIIFFIQFVFLFFISSRDYLPIVRMLRCAEICGGRTYTHELGFYIEEVVHTYLHILVSLIAGHFTCDTPPNAHVCVAEKPSWIDLKRHGQSKKGNHWR